MGFDINVMMMLYMCPETGKPYYLKWNKETRNYEKLYELPDIIVPEKMCEYLVGRGHHFHAYTEVFNEDGRYDVSVDEFMDYFPSWEEVLENPSYNDECGWCEEDHKGFKRLLEWCCKQDVSFRVSWSY